MRSTLSAALFASAAALLLSSPAQAVLVVTPDVSLVGTPYGLPLSPGAINFDTDSLGTTTGGFSWAPNAPAQFVRILNTSSGIGAKPFGDDTNYLSVLGLGTATLSSNTNTLNSLELFVGSLDTWNTFTFHAKNGDTAMIDGTTLLADIAAFTGLTPKSGDQKSDLTNLYITFKFSEAVDSIGFKSSQNSLEIDDLNSPSLNTLQGGAPEPNVWVVMLAGFGLLGLAMRSRAAAGLAGVFAS
jgi:hypothetical protein